MLGMKKKAKISKELLKKKLIADAEANAKGLLEIVKGVVKDLFISGHFDNMIKEAIGEASAKVFMERPKKRSENN